MAKGDVGSQNYSQGAMGSVPQFGTARGGYQPPFNNPMMGPSFPNMLIQMAMRNQMQQPQMQYQGFPGQQMGGGGKGSMGGGGATGGWNRNPWGLTNGSEMNRPHVIRDNDFGYKSMDREYGRPAVEPRWGGQSPISMTGNLAPTVQPITGGGGTRTHMGMGPNVGKQTELY
jgi:hypothetical protein